MLPVLLVLLGFVLPNLFHNYQERDVQMAGYTFSEIAYKRRIGEGRYAGDPLGL